MISSSMQTVDITPTLLDSMPSGLFSRNVNRGITPMKPRKYPALKSRNALKQITLNTSSSESEKDRLSSNPSLIEFSDILSPSETNSSHTSFSHALSSSENSPHGGFLGVDLVSELKAMETSSIEKVVDGRGAIKRRSLEWISNHCDTLEGYARGAGVHPGMRRVLEFQTHTNIIRDMKIYKSLAMYTFLHLTLCLKDQERVIILSNHVEEWKNWDIIQCLTKHHNIQTKLLSLLETKEQYPLCQSHVEKIDGPKLSELDALVMGHQLASVLDDTDPNDLTHKHIFHLLGEEAQSVLNLLNELLEKSILDGDLSSLFAHALVKLSKRSKQYPASLVLGDVNIDSNSACIASRLSDVYTGTTKGYQIAVKKMRPYYGTPDAEPDKLLTTCAREGAIWNRLSHQNLLPFYGVFYLGSDFGRVSFISPWMENGHINQYLESHPDTNRDPLSVSECHPWRLETAQHSRASSGTACIADFGLSEAIDPLRRLATSTQGPSHGGTVPYQAPESLLNDGPVTMAGDIYAFACMLCEIYSGKRPFHGRSITGVIADLQARRRPSRPVQVNDAMWALIQACWHEDPARRPSASDILHRLRAFIVIDDNRQQHQWDESFRMQMRRRYPLTDHPLSFRSAS
ncbi:kinase-like domain-containing protein [Hygrophoropsis aurantiaca]|uniref:Kinase-like domain-containing protein n=1 Tax=Hygrophoropsis aurantiaca TaxID=72124 RepID=A0ACB8A325_9AGAM|nr:kinase-like domain-containing protein [Hygrophoropsis aurantiaca]